jgi:hypothetical protein
MPDITFDFVQEDLDRLIENNLSFYRSRESTSTALGAVEYIIVDTPTQMLQAFSEKVAQGYTLHEGFPVNAHTANGIGFYSFYVTKPETMQAEDAAAIKVQVEQEYRTELQRRYDECLRVTVAESIAREERKAEREAAAKAEKLRAKLEAEAIAALGERPAA